MHITALFFFFFSSRRRHTRFDCDWSSDVCSSDLYGFHPAMAPLKKVWDQGKLAIVHGVGYANSPRSHFRSMDIWHTCEPEKRSEERRVGKECRSRWSPYH